MCMCICVYVFVFMCLFVCVFTCVVVCASMSLFCLYYLPLCVCLHICLCVCMCVIQYISFSMFVYFSLLAECSMLVTLIGRIYFNPWLTGRLATPASWILPYNLWTGFERELNTFLSCCHTHKLGIQTDCCKLDLYQLPLH